MLDVILTVLMLGSCIFLAGFIGYAIGFNKGVDEQFMTDQKEFDDYNEHMIRWVRNGFKDEGEE